MKIMKTLPLFVVLLLLMQGVAALDLPPAPSVPTPPPPTPGTPGLPDLFAKTAWEQLSIKKVSLPFSTSAGNAILLAIQVKNKDKKENRVAVTVSIPELGIRKRSGPGVLLAGKEITKSFPLLIPENAKTGTYLARISVSTDRFHRTIYRPLLLKKSL